MSMKIEKGKRFVVVDWCSSQEAGRHDEIVWSYLEIEGSR